MRKLEIHKDRSLLAVHTLRLAVSCHWTVSPQLRFVLGQVAGMWLVSKCHCPSSRKECGMTGKQTQERNASHSESTGLPKVNKIILKTEIVEALIM
jgi:hypothetical protein